MEIKKIIGHIRDRVYMSGIERERFRIKVTNEIFTPTERAIKDIYKLPDILFSTNTKKFHDQCCGDGQFLGEVLIRKLESLGEEEITDGEFEQALSTIYGVDLMIDNVDLCRERLLCGREDLRHIVEQNIQCRDALKFGYKFEPMGPARRNTEEKARAKQQRLKVKQEKLAKLEQAKKKKEAQQKKLFGEIIPEFI